MSFTQDNPLPDLPKINLKFPPSPLIAAAFAYAKEHTTKDVYNHQVRSAHWSLILAKKVAYFKDIDVEVVVLACMLHDLGWSHTPDFGNKDLRFEVDGAKIARRWVAAENKSSSWDKYRLQLLWDAIALHTIPSIAQHKEAEVALVSSGILVDFLVPRLPSGLIPLEEFREVVAAFPRSGFGSQGLKTILCG